MDEKIPSDMNELVKQLQIRYDKFDKCKILLEQIAEEIELLETALMFKYNMQHRAKEMQQKKDWLQGLKR